MAPARVKKNKIYRQVLYDLPMKNAMRLVRKLGICEMTGFASV